MKLVLSLVIIVTILATSKARSYINEEDQALYHDYPHQNIVYDEGAGDDDDIDMEYINDVKNHASPNINFAHILKYKIDESKSHDITTVIEQVRDTLRKSFFVVEHDIATLSLEKATKLREVYSTEFVIHNWQKSSTLPSCSTIREEINRIKTLKQMALGSATICFAGVASLLYCLKNVIKSTRSAKASLLTAKSARAGAVLLGAFGLLTAVLSYAAMRPQPSSCTGLCDYLNPSLFATDFCDYKDKLVEALDQRISQLSIGKE